MAVVVGLFGLQVAVPRVAASMAERLAGQVVQGPRPRIEITALPFWQLAVGRFQQLSAQGHDLRWHGIEASAFRLSWSDGQITPKSSKSGWNVARWGRIQGSLAIAPKTLAEIIDRSGLVSQSRVVLHARTISVTGTVHLGGKAVSLSTQGPLTLGAGGTTVTFHPKLVGLVAIPVTTSITVFNLSELRLPVALRIVSIQLSPTAIRVQFTNAARL